jgi:hypothetical protein
MPSLLFYYLILSIAINLLKPMAYRKEIDAEGEHIEDAETELILEFWSRRVTTR